MKGSEGKVYEHFESEELKKVTPSASDVRADFNWQLPIPIFKNPCRCFVDEQPFDVWCEICKQLDSETMAKCCSTNTSLHIRLTQYVNTKISKIPLHIRDTGEGSMPFINRFKIVETVRACHPLFDNKIDWVVLVMREGTIFDKVFGEDKKSREAIRKYLINQGVDNKFFTHSEEKTTVSLISNGLPLNSFKKDRQEQCQFLAEIRCQMVPLKQCLAFCMHMPIAFGQRASCRTAEGVCSSTREMFLSHFRERARFFCVEKRRSYASPAEFQMYNYLDSADNYIGTVVYREL